MGITQLRQRRARTGGRARRLVAASAMLVLVAGFAPPMVGIAHGDSGQFTLSGTVSDTAFHRVADVAVTATDILGNMSSTITDASGFYSLSLPTASYTVQFAPPESTGLVAATLPGVDVFGDVVRDVVLSDEPPPPPPPPVSVHGVLRDANGAPLSNWGVFAGDTSHVTTTAADGSYALANVPTGQQGIGVTNQPTCCGNTLLTSGYDFTADTTLDLTWPAPVPVTVTVTDPDGNPVADASLEAHNGSISPSLEFFQSDPLYPGGAPSSGIQTGIRGTTDTNGTATLQFLPSAHPASITISPPAGADLRAATVTADVDAPHTVAVTLTPPPPPPPTVSVHGVLRDTNGAPLSDWGVFAADLTHFATTGADGSYTLENIPTGEQGIGATTGRTSISGTFLTVSYNFTADTTLDLTWPASVPVTVAVTDPDGNPVADAALTAYNGSISPSLELFQSDPLYPGSGPSSGLQTGITGTTDANGTATLQFLPSTHPATITITPPASTGLVAATLPAVDVSAPHTVAVTLTPPPPPPPTVSVHGVLRDADGNALTNWGVFTDLAHFATTGADGSYLLTDVPSGPQVINVTNAPTTLGNTGLSVGYDFTADTTLDLTWPAPVAVTVTVTDTDGKPVADASLNAHNGSFSPSFEFIESDPLYPGSGPSTGFQTGMIATTDTNGTATLQFLPSTHPATITITPPANTSVGGTTLSNVDVSAPRSFTVVLATLRGVVSAGGVPLSNEAITFTPSSAEGSLGTTAQESAAIAATTNSPIVARTDASGTYAVTLPFGPYTVSLSGESDGQGARPSWYTLRAPINVTTPGSLNVTLPTVTVSVLAKTSSGSAAANANVFVPCTATASSVILAGAPATGSVCGTATTNSTGHASLRLLPVDAATLVVVGAPGNGGTTATTPLSNLTTNRSVTVTLPAPSGTTPTANAGPDLTVSSGAAFTLDASHSTSPDGTPLTYRWYETGGPIAVLQDDRTARLRSSGLNGPTTLRFRVLVTGVGGRTTIDDVVVTVKAPK